MIVLYPSLSRRSLKGKAAMWNGDGFALSRGKHNKADV